MNDSSERQWIAGAPAVRAVIEGANRHVFRLLVQQDRMDGVTGIIQRAARDRSIPVDRVSDETIHTVVGSDPYDSVMAEVGPRRFLTLPDLLGGPSVPSVFMLDGVEDPYNLGQAIRSLYALGASGLVLRPRQWLSATNTIIRSSSGASEIMRIATNDDPAEVMAFFRNHGLKVLAADLNDAIPITEVDLRSPFFMMIGGEKRGISRSLLRQVDERIAIPYGTAFDASLGTAAAAAILGYEMLRQRTQADPSH